MAQARSVKIVVSPDRMRLVVDDNIQHEDQTIFYDVLFNYLQKAIPSTNFHYEFTDDLSTYDQDSAEVVKLQPGEAVTTSTDIQVTVEDLEDE